MGALKPGDKNYVHIVVKGLKKSDVSKLKAEMRKLAKKFGGSPSTRRKPQF